MQPIFIRGSYGRMPLGSFLSPLEVSYGPVIWWHGVAALQKTQDPKQISRSISRLCEAIFRELQARSFDRYPQTRFEKELGDKQLEIFARRQRRVFGRG